MTLQAHVMKPVDFCFVMLKNEELEPVAEYQFLIQISYCLNVRDVSYSVLTKLRSLQKTSIFSLFSKKEL